jgi:hypothetical protein
MNYEWLGDIATVFTVLSFAMSGLAFLRIVGMTGSAIWCVYSILENDGLMLLGNASFVAIQAFRLGQLMQPKIGNRGKYAIWGGVWLLCVFFALFPFVLGPWPLNLNRDSAILLFAIFTTIVSYAVRTIVPLRMVSFVSCVAWITYGIVLHYNSVAITNILIALINVFYLVRYAIARPNH